MLDISQNMIRDDLVRRLRPDAWTFAHFKDAILSAFGLLDKFQDERNRVLQDRRFSDQGQREKVAELVREKYASQLANGAGKVARHNAERNESRLVALGRLEYEKNDVVAELGRQEVRSLIRNQPPEKRFTTACECIKDRAMAEAIMSGVNGAVLTGLSPDQFAQLRRMYLSNFFADELADIEGVRDDTDAIQAAVSIVRKKLFDTSGMSDIQFRDLWRELEKKADKG